MPVIRRPTARGLRLFPGLTGGQLFGLIGTAAGVLAVWHAGGGLGVRLPACAALTAAGTAYVLGRWPATPDGDRLAVWIPRIVRHMLQPAVRAGADVRGWDGLEHVSERVLHHRGGWAMVMEIGGADFGVRGRAATAAAQAAFHELLHGLSGALQIVGTARALRGADRPLAWNPESSPPGLARVADAYAAHWNAIVTRREAFWRRSFLVFTVPRDAPDAASRMAAMEAAARRFGERTGLPVRRLAGGDLLRLLREMGGAADLRLLEPTGEPWRVTVRHG